MGVPFLVAGPGYLHVCYVFFFYADLGTLLEREASISVFTQSFVTLCAPLPASCDSGCCRWHGAINNRSVCFLGNHHCLATEQAIAVRQEADEGGGGAYVSHAD